MSEYTSKLITLRHFLKIFSMIHKPLKPIASFGCDTSIIFCVRNEHFKSKYTPKLEYLVHVLLFFIKFSGGIYISLNP